MPPRSSLFTSTLKSRIIPPSRSLISHSKPQCLSPLHSPSSTRREPPSLSYSKPILSSSPTIISSRPYHTHSSTTRLTGRVCMVTGGSSGIGLAIAQRFMHEGATKLILVGRNKARLQDALKMLRTPHNEGEEEEIPAAEAESAQSEASESTTGNDAAAIAAAGHCEIYDSGRFTMVVGDVGNPGFWGEDIKKLMDNVDILVNAAGISYSALLPFAKDEHIMQTLHTNLQGTIFACRTMARRLLRRKRASPTTTTTTTTTANGENVKSATKCIINVSSLHAWKGAVGVSTYAATKAGVIALTRSIAAEGGLSGDDPGRRLRANVIVPGYIETKMLDELSEKTREEAKKSIPLRRFGTTGEVADAAVFLATNEYANNCVLNLDGGLSAV
ncbi:hypothetical protein AJ80_04968 [Polytolypa hystricis UAMH7299]|uniref:3-oxoacyl-[acyl-carrier protein] reductase n=1 Tax=Polytolypa hystricis (strain UAMH7299) TaxID=1447883 RepID=A0A2B7Y788_POLH7|nr:hypothetical protein AJ80_04968 [Polytolypa hystricis UAMH7299]